MDRFLGKETQEQREKKREIGLRSLYHCQEERRKLRKCLRESWIGWCSKEHSIFWECFCKV